MRGRPTGPAVAGTTRLLNEQESTRVRAMLAAKHPILHGRLVPALHRRKGAPARRRRGPVPGKTLADLAAG
jgi:hypothetical protein